MKLYSINTGYFKLDGGAMFGVVPKSIWNKLNPADENNILQPLGIKKHAGTKRRQADIN